MKNQKIYYEISETEPKRINNTISFYESGFIFWDEVNYDFYGPYPTLFECKANLKEYCENHL